MNNMIIIVIKNRYVFKISVSKIKKKLTKKTYLVFYVWIGKIRSLF